MVEVPCPALVCCQVQFAALGGLLKKLSFGNFRFSLADAHAIWIAKVIGWRAMLLSVLVREQPRAWVLVHIFKEFALQKVCKSMRR